MTQRPTEPLGYEGGTVPKLDGAVLLNQPAPSIEDLTFVDLVGLAFTKAKEFAIAAGHSPAGREFALTQTHLEDAVMRFNRGAAIVAGVFQVADVEAEHGLAVKPVEQAEEVN